MSSGWHAPTKSVKVDRNKFEGQAPETESVQRVANVEVIEAFVTLAVLPGEKATVAVFKAERHDAIFESLSNLVRYAWQAGGMFEGITELICVELAGVDEFYST